MNKKPDPHDIDSAREQSLANRETWRRAHEVVASEQREHSLEQREQAVQARAALLIASQTETDSGEHMRTIDLAEVVATAVDAVSALVREHRHSLRVSLSPSLWVHGHRARLGLFIADILIDAAQCAPEGGSIEVVGERVGHRVRLVVSDNSVGVRAEVRLPSSPS